MSSAPDLLDAERENYLRLMQLLVEGGTPALRKQFEDGLVTLYPGATLGGVLAAKKGQLQQLKTKGILNHTQWGMLYPASGDPDMNSFDITLLSVLLRNIGSSRRPTDPFWNNDPPDTDTSEEANYVRLRLLRNEIGHSPYIKIIKGEFETYWRRISNVLISLGGNRGEIDHLKTKPLATKDYVGVLQQWMASDFVIFEELQEIRKENKQRDEETKEILMKIESDPDTPSADEHDHEVEQELMRRIREAEDAAQREKEKRKVIEAALAQMIQENTSKFVDKLKEKELTESEREELLQLLVAHHKVLLENVSCFEDSLRDKELGFLKNIVHDLNNSVMNVKEGKEELAKLIPKYHEIMIKNIEQDPKSEKSYQALRDTTHDLLYALRDIYQANEEHAKLIPKYHEIMIKNIEQDPRSEKSYQALRDTTHDLLRGLRNFDQAKEEHAKLIPKYHEIMIKTIEQDPSSDKSYQALRDTTHDLLHGLRDFDQAKEEHAKLIPKYHEIMIKTIEQDPTSDKSYGELKEMMCELKKLTSSSEIGKEEYAKLIPKYHEIVIKIIEQDPKIEKSYQALRDTTRDLASIARDLPDKGKEEVNLLDAERENYLRLLQLLVEGGTPALRKQFEDGLVTLYPGATLGGVLAAKKGQLQQLKTKGILNHTQWGMLYPASGDPNMNNFDITLLSVLLRNIGSSRRPTDPFWNNDPPDTDTSKEANYVRLRLLRNEIGHSPNITIKEGEFETYWRRISNVLISLGGNKGEIDHLKTKPLATRDYVGVVQRWRALDDRDEEAKQRDEEAKQRDEEAKQRDEEAKQRDEEAKQRDKEAKQRDEEIRKEFNKFANEKHAKLIPKYHEIMTKNIEQDPKSEKSYQAFRDTTRDLLHGLRDSFEAQKEHTKLIPKYHEIMIKNIEQDPKSEKSYQALRDTTHDLVDGLRDNFQAQTEHTKLITKYHEIMIKNIEQDPKSEKSYQALRDTTHDLLDGLRDIFQAQTEHTKLIPKYHEIMIKNIEQDPKSEKSYQALRDTTHDLYAYNVTFRDVNQSIGKALLESALHDNNMDNQAQSVNLKKTMMHLKPVFENYVKDAEGQRDLIGAIEDFFLDSAVARCKPKLGCVLIQDFFLDSAVARCKPKLGCVLIQDFFLDSAVARCKPKLGCVLIQDFFLDNAWRRDTLQVCLHLLYEMDVLDEAVILHWHAHPGPSNDDQAMEEQKRDLRQTAARFVTWLKEAEEESDDEDDDD
ncbi:predicted protein [Nematostella vectensis]|uniref:W2 domain-containing protein n=1 Tax=Nematostella vectensis TaxID=45351 RepID=A7SW76_NEMVE|nr:predicted protein [Nematostella vectensis]|eukprot:XP_001624139.1 predicted protein [Nematostella vectensis]